MFYLLIRCCYYFFFFKQKTAYELRISDWSSDVCASDLQPIDCGIGLGEAHFTRHQHITEMCEHFAFRLQKGRPELMAEIGDSEKRNAGLIQFSDKLRHSFDPAPDAVVEARAP